MSSQFSKNSSIATTLLLIIFPFLHFSSINIGNESFDEFLFGAFAAISILASVALATVFAVVAKKVAAKMPIERTLSVFYIGYSFFFLYSTMNSVFTSLVVPLLGRGADLSYVFTAIVVLGLSFWLSKFNIFHLAVFVFVLILTCFSAIRFVNNAPYFDEKIKTSSVNESRKLISTDEFNAHDVLPNVYFIIVDGYTSVSVLNNLLNFDNHDFIREMEHQGFVHQSDNFSAYTVTYLSLAAMMQGDFPVIEDSPRYKNRDDFYPSLLKHAEPPATIKKARDLGYTVMKFGNAWFDCHPKHLTCPPKQTSLITSYEILTFLELTPFSWVRKNTDFFDPESVVAGSDAIGPLLDYLKNKRDSNEPYFFFIHHLPPHPPYIYKSDCTIRTDTDYDFQAWSNEAKPYYLDNLKCTNKRLIELSTYINNIDPGAIVIIQGDHGTAFDTTFSVKIDEWPRAAIRERLAILSLIKAPENCRKWIPPQLNTVNAVRFVFGCIFETSPQYLPNDSFIAVYQDSHPDYGRVSRVTLKDLLEKDFVDW